MAPGTTMSSNDQPTMRIECTECEFSTVVTATDGRNPYETVEMHGTESGHTLEMSVVEE